jgi:hypothetical protein
MSFNGSGTFVINSAGQPVVANTVISATTFNALTSDLANGLSTCITKDGQTTPTANIPMGGFKITNLATGTAASDAATVAQIQSNGAALVTVTGTDTLTGTLTPALVAYVTGAVYYFVAPATNTGAVTLNIDTLGAKNVTRDGTTALVAGDIVSGEMVAVVYDGTRFQLISPVNSFTNLNVSGTLTVAGATTLNGNLQVGNAAADTVNFQASGWTLTNNVSVTGTWADIGTITTADINGGTIDGTTIGGGTAAAGTFTTVGATTGNITTVNATTVDATSVEVTNLKAKDGTAAGSIADSTGVVTLNSVVATTADINGGTIDATTIGGSSPAVGNFTTVSAASAVFTTATITTVNTTTLDLTNLEVTNIKAKDGTASMVIDDLTGKVNVTTVSAASMNAAVAAITTGSVTSLTATAASVASMNAGVALLTTATVTTLNASGASIASANIGNLQFTAASIASINAGVAVINNLTATSASVASANVGVALITTGTVTNLTATGASVASANVGTAVITGLTVTGASIASVNAGTATLSGNLTLNGGTANGVLYLNGSKVATSGTALWFDGTNFGVGTGGNSLNQQFVIYKGGANAVYQQVANGSTGLSATNGVRLGVSSGGSGELYAPTALISYIDNSEATRLTSTGLGIGTSSPSAKVHAVNTSGYSLGLSGSTKGVRVVHDSTRTIFQGVDNTLSASYQPLMIAGSIVELGIEGTAKVTLDASGNLGIGTSSPAGKVNAVSTSGFTAPPLLCSDTVGTFRVVFNPSTYANVPANKPWLHSYDDIYIGSDAGTSFNVMSGGTKNLTVTSDGNLGLGVTPSAWWSAIKTLQMSGNGFVGSASNYTYLGSNFFYNSSANPIYVASDAASLFEQGAGAFKWYTAASGTAGNAISFTQALTLDADGDLGVGITAPSCRLDLAGPSTAGLTNLVQLRTGSGNSFGFQIKGDHSTDGYLVQNYYNSYLAFGTNNTERARITSGGEFLIGTSSGIAASEVLLVKGAGSTSATYLARFINSSNSAAFAMENAGRLITGTLADSPYNYVVGGTNRDLYVDSAGSLGYVSSTRESKANIAPIENASWLLGLNPVTFNRRKRNESREYTDELYSETEYGLIAEEVEDVNADLCFYDNAEEGGKLRGVTYSKLITPMLKLLQEQQAMIKSLEAKVAALESK